MDTARGHLGIRDDDDDQERLLRFLNQKPQIEQAMLAQMEARTRYLNSLADAAQRGGGHAMTALAGPEQISIANGARWLHRRDRRLVHRRA